MTPCCGVRQTRKKSGFYTTYPSNLRTEVRKGVSSGFPPPLYSAIFYSQSRNRVYCCFIYIHQPEGPPFRILTFSSRSGIVSIYRLIRSKEISLSQISSNAFFKSSNAQPPCGFLFRNLCLRTLHMFSIGLRSGEQGGQLIDLIWHSTRIPLHSPWFIIVSDLPCTLLLSSTQK